MYNQSCHNVNYSFLFYADSETSLVSGKEFAIPDEKITTSSMYDQRHGPQRSRLKTRGQW